MSAAKVRLTSLAHGGGCGCKLAPAVLQELLSNSAKHTQPKHIEVKLHFGAHAVHLAVKDDGKGFDPATPRPGHYGLINLRERAMKLGGDVTIDARPGEGAHSTFSAPVN